MKNIILNKTKYNKQKQKKNPILYIFDLWKKIDNKKNKNE